MALHKRTLIRHAAKAALLNKTPARARIETQKKESWEPADKEAIAIYTGADEVDEDSMSSAPRDLLHRLELRIVCVLQRTSSFVSLHNNSIEDALDTFAGLVEDAISIEVQPAGSNIPNGPLGGTVSDVVLTSTDEPNITEVGDQLIASLTLNFLAKYRLYAPTAATLDDFDEADIRYSLSNAVHPDNQAHDDLTGLYES